ncbi:MAG TPA: GAF domain-containing protein, partial [Pyrinomonadaceae bacterium]|nr:GAF domain-containing protein [Pyrinomonadaceae bacterium]
MKGKVLTSWSLVWLLGTVLLVAGGALNLSQRTYHQLPPTDGVVWTQRADGIYAEKVFPGLAASRAGVSVGDRLFAISLDEKQFDEIVSPSDVAIYLDTAGVGGSLTYSIKKPYSFSDSLYLADLRNIDSLPRWTASLIFLIIVGVIWLGVGVFVLFKQGSHAPFVLHFATVCLAAFVFQVYKPLGFGQDFDMAVSLFCGNAVVLFFAVFFFFFFFFPVQTEVFGSDRRKIYLLYAPALLIIAANLFFSISLVLPIGDGVKNAIAGFIDQIGFFKNLNTILTTHFVIGVSYGGCILLWRFFRNKQTLVRQRLKWAVWGTIVAVVPILLFQIAKRFVPSLTEDYLTSALTTLPLALIPFSFGHSVVRYRLMDVDVVVRRALVYAMTTVAIAMMIGAVALLLVFLAVGNNLSTTEITLRALIAVVAMAAIVMLSEPLKKFLQERADRFFYGERYDLRRGLLDFGRTLSATTALDPLLNALTERLRQVLDVEKVAVFIESDNDLKNYRLAKSVGLHEDFNIPSDFRQMIRQKSAARGIVRADELEITETEKTNGNGIIRQELHYFVPCVARGKMVAVIGLGRASDGSLLSSEDLEILQTVSGYVAVAVENALLYQEQEKRTEELALLNEDLLLYELSFKNIGGLVMPVILEWEYADGTKEVERIPAELWKTSDE